MGGERTNVHIALRARLDPRGVMAFGELFALGWSHLPGFAVRKNGRVGN